MSVHASAYFELMHYKRVIVNWLCDNAYAYIKPESTGRVYRFRVQKRHTARSRLQEQYTGKGHGGHTRSLYTAPEVWTFGRSKVGVRRFGQCSGQLALAKNAIRCIWALASCYRR